MKKTLIAVLIGALVIACGTGKALANKASYVEGDVKDGMGKRGKALKPNPRNFTCSDTMKKVFAGQMFWIIKNGSPGTGMVAHKKTLKDKDIWDIVKYIRTNLMK